jgi:hypothetical protein
MPFGTKLGAEGEQIDLNRVHEEYIRPALNSGGAVDCWPAATTAALMRSRRVWAKPYKVLTAATAFILASARTAS